MFFGFKKAYRLEDNAQSELYLVTMLTFQTVSSVTIFLKLVAF